MPVTADKFESSNQPPAIEPIFVAGAVFIVAVLLIIALLLAAA
jgi:preprotein translocase subunit Sec61beta